MGAIINVFEIFKYKVITSRIWVLSESFFHNDMKSLIIKSVWKVGQASRSRQLAQNYEIVWKVLSQWICEFVQKIWSRLKFLKRGSNLKAKVIKYILTSATQSVASLAMGRGDLTLTFDLMTEPDLEKQIHYVWPSYTLRISNLHLLSSEVDTFKEGGGHP